MHIKKNIFVRKNNIAQLAKKRYSLFHRIAVNYKKTN